MVDKHAIIIKAKLAALNAFPASDIYSESVMMPLVDVWHIGWTHWRLRASRPLRDLEQTNKNPNNIKTSNITPSQLMLSKQLEHI